MSENALCVAARSNLVRKCILRVDQTEFFYLLGTRKNLKPCHFGIKTISTGFDPTHSDCISLECSLGF